MKPEGKKQLVSFLWKLLTALLAALGGTTAASAAIGAGIL